MENVWFAPKHFLACVGKNSKRSHTQNNVNAKVGFDKKDAITAKAVLRFFPPSQRDEINQPRVARNELPWVNQPQIRPTLKGLHQCFFDHCRRLARSGQRAQQVNVVCNATHDNWLAIEVGQNSAKITVQFAAQNLVAQKWAAVFG